MILVTRTARFSAGHRYYLPGLSPGENDRLYGACARPHGHGHDYLTALTVEGAIDPVTGMVVNIADLKRLLAERVVAPLDGAFLTREHPLMCGVVPTTEALCGVIRRLIEAPPAELDPASIRQVKVQEARRLWSRSCWEEQPKGIRIMKTYLTRVYEFAAAHRLHAPGLDEETNRRIYGKCNNPHGHGHNYELEVTVTGEPDPITGLLVDLPWLDNLVDEEVTNRYDHRHLNLDLPEFREVIPTSENLVLEIWNRLSARLPSGMLAEVTVRETGRNSFTMRGNESE